MLVKITEDLIIDPMEVIRINKEGKDIFVWVKNQNNFSLSIYSKKGKEFLKYFRSYAQDPE